MRTRSTTESETKLRRPTHRWATSRRLATGMALVIASVVMLGADIAAAQRIRVTIAPPAPREETRGTARWEGAEWQSGYWTWNGRNWVWRSGRWIRPRRFGWTWVSPRWVDRGGYWVYVPGRWTRQPGWRASQPPPPPRERGRHRRHRDR